MNREEHSHQNITTGDIKDSIGVVIGSGHVNVNSPPPPPREELAELIALLNAFIQSLGSYENALSNSWAVRKEAEAARAEAEGPSPRWDVIRRSLRGIGASVASVAALTDAINNLELLVAHIAH